MADNVRPIYRPGLNRNPTKKWAEAQQVDYEADDWGDEYDDYQPPMPEPVSAGPQRHPGWGQRTEQSSSKDFITPSTATNVGRSSYDTEDERRYFSTGSSDQRYQDHLATSKLPPQEHFDPSARDVQHPPSLQLDTQFPSPNTGAKVRSQVSTKGDTYNVPFSAPAGQQVQPFHSEKRAEYQQDRHSETSQGPRTSGPGAVTAGYAPRQSSLSQQQILLRGSDLSQSARTAPSSAQTESIDSKPLPFVRPADIYKRVEQERKKERLSQDSSRPSIDSTSGRITNSSTQVGVPVGNTAPTKTGQTTSGDADLLRNTRSTLDAVVGRKGELGLSPTSAGVTYSPNTASNNKLMSPSSATTVDTASRPQISRAASSVYTDRPDPTSATSTGSHPLPSAIGSAMPPSAESYQHNILQYSPSKHRLSGLQSEVPDIETGEDFPNYNHGFSSKPKAALSSPKSMHAESPSTKTISASRSPPTRSDKLQHQPSLGYQSVVHQAFDAGQASTLSPTSTSDTLPRTSSTSDISPIIQRTSDVRNTEFSKQPGAPTPVSGERVSPYSHDRSESVATVKAPEQTQDNTILPATTFVPGYRRDNTPPVTETTRARRPLSVEVPAIQEAQHGVLSNVTTSATSTKGLSTETLPATQYTPIAGRQSPPKQFKSQSDLSRTESEDWTEWQEQRRSFNAKHGYQDSNSPTMSSPVSRSQSPAKGTVRDIAGRLDTNSGRSSPAVTHGLEGRSTKIIEPSKPVARVPESTTTNITKPDSTIVNTTKPQQLRNDSFRPPLPGSWQSYTTDSKPQTPEPSVPIKQPATLLEQGRTESTDSIPTAIAPRQWQSSRSAQSEAAFAAAAAAGTAMAGAFSGSSLTQEVSSDSDLDSDEEDTPSASQPHIPQISETRDFALRSPQMQPPVPANNTVASKSIEPPVAESNIGTSRELPKQVDYPAPLRMSKLFENKEPSPRLSVLQTSQSETDEDPEQLQHDIVQSLTPKASAIQDVTIQPREMPLRPRETTRQFSIYSDDGGDSFPQEYNSYWDDQQTTTKHDNKLEEISREKEDRKTKTPEPTPSISASTFGIGGPATETRSFLEPRYSWETPKAERIKAPEPSVSAFEKSTTIDKPVTGIDKPLTTVDKSLTTIDRPLVTTDKPLATIEKPLATADRPLTTAERSSTPTDKPLTTNNKPSTPTDAPVRPLSTLSPPTPTVHRVAEVAQDTPRSGGQTISLPTKPPLPIDFPREKTDFRNILAFKEPSQRIRAFDENRQLYAQHNGLLDRWITSMNTPEHSDVFRAGRLPRAQTNIGLMEIRPSPRRETTATSGTKQMQEDGKRLIAAAGKYGGKAGTVAKGLFARGKDKFRTVSSGDKVPTTGRRPSSNVDVDTSFTPRPQEPVLPERAPQLPTPSLDTPTGETSWSSMFNTFNDQSQPTSAIPSASNTIPSSAATRSTDRSRGLSGRQQDSVIGQYGPRTGPPSTERPPASVLAALPGGEDVPVKSQVFPNYNAGIKADKNTTVKSTPGKISQTSSRNAVAVPQANTEADRSRKSKREDSSVLPRPRRPSSISDVSDMSAAQNDPADVLPRTVSPSLENSLRGPSIPLIVAPQLTKEEEAAQNQNRSSLAEGTLPVYSSIKADNNNAKPPRIQPGTQIVPVADLRPSDAEGDQESDSRPFSFFGPETLDRSVSQREPVKPLPPAAQHSPVEQDLPVDIEKSPQPNITEHPAYRSSREDPSNAEQANPLPSTRRSPQGLDQTRKHQQIVVPEQVQGEGGYRIPGPYGQEYRSPRSTKPTASQDSTHIFRNTPEQSPNVSSPMQNRFSSDLARGQTPETTSQFERQPEPERNNKRGFGGMFRTRSKSPSKQYDRQGTFSPTPQSDQVADESKRLPRFFNLSNRPIDSSSQTSDNRDAPLQDTGRDRKLSIDMLRPMFAAKPQPDGKKKRTSGFGALFGRPNGKDKDNIRHDRTASQPAIQPTAQSGSQSYYRSSMGNHIAAQLQEPASAMESHRDTGSVGPEPYTHRRGPSGNIEDRYGMPDTAYQETQAYHNSGEQHFDHEKSGINNWQQSVANSQRLRSEPGFPMSTIPGIADPHQVPSEPLTPPVPASQTPNPIPNTRANRDISYGQDRPYIPPVSPRPAHGTGQVSMGDHVKNLHKRSRSPRLGRPPSDEGLRAEHIDPNEPGRQYSPDPASQLGTFQNLRMSPGGGVPRSAEDQEKPWRIGLPEEAEGDDSDSDVRVSSRANRSAASDTYHTVPDPPVVSPATPYQQAHHDNIGRVVSPITAVEPQTRGFATLPASSRPDGAAVQTVTVPPTISSAGQIPHPNPQAHNPVIDEPTQPAIAPSQTLAQPSTQPSRGMKQTLIERAPNNSQADDSTVPRPQTVAEKLMGVQVAGRGAVPEHRSTTPVSHSPAPSVGGQSKSTTWPDARPSTTAVTTSTGTTVTTTTMRTGSKLGKGGVKTSTYIIDTDTPSRTNSNAALSGNKVPINAAFIAPTSGSALTPITTNPKGSTKMQPSTGSRDLTNGTNRASYGKSFDAVELPGSKPDGYESEEDIVMSATTYPGQEWMPEFAGAADWD